MKLYTRRWLAALALVSIFVALTVGAAMEEGGSPAVAAVAGVYTAGFCTLLVWLTFKAMGKWWK